MAGLYRLQIPFRVFFFFRLVWDVSENKTGQHDDDEELEPQQQSRTPSERAWAPQLLARAAQRLA